MRITDGMVGGRAELDAAVERFHERVSADPELVGVFAGMDMKRILERQMTLLALVAGVPAQSATATRPY
jgi:truncated hemoglobin YjbI